MRSAFAFIIATGLLVACQQEQTTREPAYDGIDPAETIRFTGTEPFWNGEIIEGMARYSTPDMPDGSSFPVERFAGLNGVGFSGELQGERFDLTITPGECSDAMSDRSYPFTATLLVGDETREGCAWTDRKPYSDPENP
ncbi:hypothetical protein P8Q88_00820 [Qipengyuania sp. XHP0207]|uniref:COG3650 family protein n=1 Tax=Qipengyuania sp. XHP0207 TaxID=3038078 RepID=UPI00241C313C|nr:hypothetical protein [Qipengyuania sp. XHP0207]MDG5746711.1 hypothetical protein [Qipengyuania sp. XHP0207]